MGIAREGLEPHRWNRRRRGSLILLKIVHFSRDSWTSSVQSRVGVTFLAIWSWVCSPGIGEFVRGGVGAPTLEALVDGVQDPPENRLILTVLVG